MSQELIKLPGVTLLSGPGMTVLSGNAAYISVGEEWRYFTPPAANPAAPPEKTTQIIAGSGLAAKATVAEDNASIALELRPRLTERAGTVLLPAKGGVPDPNDVLPVFVTREQAGNVTVMDGETVVFGPLPFKAVRVGHDDITNPAMLGREIQDKVAALPARHVLVLVTVNLVSPGGRGQSGNRAKFVVPTVPLPSAP